MTPYPSYNHWRCCVPCRLTVKTFPDEVCPRCEGVLVFTGVDQREQLIAGRQERKR